MSLYDKLANIIYNSPLYKKQREKIEQECSKVAESIAKKVFISTNASIVVNQLGTKGEYEDSGLKIVEKYSEPTIYWNGTHVFSSSTFDNWYVPGDWETLLEALAKYARKQEKVFYNILESTTECDSDDYGEEVRVHCFEKESTYNDCEMFGDYSFKTFKLYYVSYKGETVFSVYYVDSSERMKYPEKFKFRVYIPGEWEEVIAKVAAERRKTPEEIKQEEEQQKQKQKSIFEERLKQLNDINNLKH